MNRKQKVLLAGFLVWFIPTVINYWATAYMWTGPLWREFEALKTYWTILDMVSLVGIGIILVGVIMEDE